ncbi:hypothetical protein TNCV_1420491 [Trichonephila clavipes]|nr:hypothetical protein TNCV_1420491 [Trichonephila clavipes]
METMESTSWAETPLQFKSRHQPGGLAELAVDDSECVVFMDTLWFRYTLSLINGKREVKEDYFLQLGLQKPSNWDFDLEDSFEMREIQSNLRYFCLRFMYSRSTGNLTYSSPRCAPCLILPELCYSPRPTKDDVILPLRFFSDIYSRATIAGPAQQNRMENVNQEGYKVMPISEKIQRDLLKAKKKRAENQR